jgi:hypothetical protein
MAKITTHYHAKYLGGQAVETNVNIYIEEEIQGEYQIHEIINKKLPMLPSPMPEIAKLPNLSSSSNSTGSTTSHPPGASQYQQAYKPEASQHQQAYKPEASQYQQAYKPEASQHQQAYKPEASQHQQVYKPEASGNSHPKPATPVQLRAVRNISRAIGISEDDLCNRFNVPVLEEINHTQVQEVFEMREKHNERNAGLF